MNLLLIFAASFLAAAAVGAGLQWLRGRFAEDGDPLHAAIVELLPRTQCAQCGYPGCAPYARALADGERIDLCPPGGQPLIDALAELLARPEASSAGDGRWQQDRVAYIDEAACVGCARCIEACPVDAIVGAPRFMHTVIAAECTGCELCLPPCPVDCIDLLPASLSP